MPSDRPISSNKTPISRQLLIATGNAKLRRIALCLTLLLAFPSIATLPQSFLEDHCLECHDTDTKKGGLDLSKLSFDSASRDSFNTWVKIHDRIDRGEMPPKKKPRPPQEETRTLLNNIYLQLEQADSQRISESGRVRMRRMTRSEFENTIADLLALPRLEIKSLLPPDGSVAGFDKVADGLDLSPAHLAAYSEAVEKALNLAIATRSTPPPVFKRRIYPAGLFKFRGNLQQGQFVLLKDLTTDPAYPPRGGFEDVTGYIAAKNAEADMPERKKIFEENKIAESHSSVGLLNPNLSGYEAAMNVSPIYAGNYRIRTSAWGFHWNAGSVERGPAQAAVLRAHEEGKQQEGGRLLSLFTAPSLAPTEHEFTTWLDAHESVVFDPVSLHWLGLRVGQVGGRAAKYIGPGVALDWFEIEGPLHPEWPPESHRRLFGNLVPTKVATSEQVILPKREPVRGIGGYIPNFHSDLPPHERKPELETVSSANPEQDAKNLLSTFIPRAFRRPVEPQEIEPYVRLVLKRISANDCFEDAMRRAYLAVLTSPEFLFHPADEKRDTRPSTNRASFTLASRLSYWLWNSPPDAPLLAAAQDNSLQTPEVIQKHVQRLLADPRSERFIRDFTDQWLELRRTQETTPDRKLYPEYHFLLHESMVAETQAFIRELIETDAPITSLLRPGFSMLNQRLAEHYGITDVSGIHTRKVSLKADSSRGGILGQAAIHKLTANGTTTSPVKRGVWVMDRLLDEPPPPPPPSAGAIDPDTRGATTVREQLDKHRNNSGCSACHSKIDPAGFALESFDPIGGLRDRYRSTDKGDSPPEKGRTTWKINYRLGPLVDSSGELADGTTFSGLNEFTARLNENPEHLARAFVAHLSRYATGTNPSFADRSEIHRIVHSTAPQNFGFRSLINALATSSLLTPSKR
jgi:hypothetical protein